MTKPKITKMTEDEIISHFADFKTRIEIDRLLDKLIKKVDRLIELPYKFSDISDGKELNDPFFEGQEYGFRTVKSMLLIEKTNILPLEIVEETPEEQNKDTES